MIRELDTIFLQTDLQVHGLKAGDIGTVVLVHRAKDGGEGRRGYEIEFMTLDGETVAVTSLYAHQIRPIAVAKSPTSVPWKQPSDHQGSGDAPFSLAAIAEEIIEIATDWRWL